MQETNSDLPRHMNGAELDTWIRSIYHTPKDIADVLQTSEDVVELWLNDIEEMPQSCIDKLARYESGLFQAATRLSITLSAAKVRPIVLDRWKTREIMRQDPSAPDICVGAHAFMVTVIRNLLRSRQIDCVVRWREAPRSAETRTPLPKSQESAGDDAS